MALITDGRFSGGSHGFVVGHITPEAYVGGPIALVKNGDPITIDAEQTRVNLDIPAAELRKRQESVEATEAALHSRRAGEIRQRRHERVARCGDGCEIEPLKIELVYPGIAFRVLRRADGHPGQDWRRRPQFESRHGHWHCGDSIVVACYVLGCARRFRGGADGFQSVRRGTMKTASSAFIPGRMAGNRNRKWT